MCISCQRQFPIKKSFPEHLVRFQWKRWGFQTWVTREPRDPLSSLFFYKQHDHHHAHLMITIIIIILSASSASSSWHQRSLEISLKHALTLDSSQKLLNFELVCVD